MDRQSKTVTHSIIQKKLGEACKWAGVEAGRAKEYQRHLEQFHVKKINSRESLLGITDIIDIIYVWDFWKVHENTFQGIRNKICRVIEEGAILADDENIIFSNTRERDDLFVFLFAGRLIQSGVQVLSIDGIPQVNNRINCHGDIVCGFQNEEVVIECKRPQKLKTIGSCARKAAIQIKKSGRKGCIALDCSKAIRPPEALLNFSNDEKADNALQERIEVDIIPKIASYFNQSVVGAIWVASVSAMKTVNESTILSPNGTPCKQYLPFKVSISRVVSNETTGESHPFMKWVYSQLKSSQQPLGFA